MTILQFTFAVLFGTLAASCSGEPLTVCTSELRIAYSPFDTAITIGGQFTQRVSLSSCGGREHLTDVISWSSADSTIARINSVTGLVTGVEPGSTLLSPVGQLYHGLGSVRVTVR